jgi:cytochrome oxidase Cu insertion factor (SCO1/SenC/PrrC family)
MGGVIAAGLVLAAAIGWTLGRLSSGGSEGTAMPVLGRAPAYHHLTNQLAAPVSSDDFKGKVQVVTFLFPYCTTYCPLIAAHLVGLENLLKTSALEDKVEIVAFNVDPSGTGPREMRAFMKEYGWDPTDLHWQYLTGQPAVIRKIVTGGFHIAYERVEDGDSGGTDGAAQTPQPEVVNELARRAHAGYDITHNDGLIIVDPRGRIRRIYDSADTVSGHRMLQTIKALATTADGP